MLSEQRQFELQDEEDYDTLESFYIARAIKTFCLDKFHSNDMIKYLLRSVLFDDYPGLKQVTFVQYNRHWDTVGFKDRTCDPGIFPANELPRPSKLPTSDEICYEILSPKQSRYSL